MPKLLKTYSNFTGGLNTVDNDRTINDNEVASLKDAVIDRKGFIVSSGRFADNTSNYRAPTIDASQAGYGLFQYKSDYDQAGNNESIVRTLLADADDGGEVEISVYSSDTNVWTDAQIGLGTVTSNEQGKVIYHIADGAVRICDTNITNVSTAIKKYGYVKAQDRWLNSAGTAQTPASYAGVAAWLSSDVKLSKPTRGFVSEQIFGTETMTGGNETTLTSSSVGGAPFVDAIEDELEAHWIVKVGGSVRDLIDHRDSTTVLDMGDTTHDNLATSVYKVYPPSGTGFNLSIVPSAGGSWTAGTYEFGITFVYDGNQESLVKGLANTISVSANEKITVNVLATESESSGTRFNSRITGARIYHRISGSDDAWTLFGDVNLRYGSRSSLDGEYSYWSEEYSNSPYIYSPFISYSENIDTYESINGFSPDSAFISIGLNGEKYQTSVVSNRRTFIGNVKYTNEEGELLNRGDTIRYSEINKFDTFPEFNFIDIGVNDGEEFIKLEAYADRLLAFKEKTLYVINIGGGSDTQWFLESEHKNMGVEFHAATVKTDFGVAWVNKNGLFFYDGSQIRNLQTKIHQTEDVGEINSWNNFVNKTYIDTMIGYEPKRKHLIIIKDAGSDQYDGNSGDAFIYSFETNSFSFVENFAPDAVKTNMITDAYNNLSVGTALDEIETYDGTPAASLSGGGFGITLKNDDFGLPGVVKKVYGMTVEYSSSHTSGSIDFKYYHTDSAGTKQGIASAFTPPATAGDLDVFQQEFKNSGSLAPISANSFQPHFSCHNLDGIHKVHSVTVEYRPIKKRIT